MLNRQFHFKIPALLLLQLLSFTALSQRVITNSQGDRVIVYPNGSSRIADQRDSALIRQYLQQGPSDQLINGRLKNKAEVQEFLQKQWNELYANILAEQKVMQQNFRDATNAQFKASQMLESAEVNKKLMEADHLATLHNEYKASVSNLRIAKRCQEDIKKIVEKAKKINTSPSKLNSGKLDKTKANFNLFRAECNPGGKVTVLKNDEFIPPPPVIPSFEHSLEKVYQEVKTDDPVIITPVAASASAMYDPSMVNKRPSQYDKRPYASESFECNFRIDTTDVATGTRKIELAPSLVFTHTDPDLRPYFKARDLITAYSRLTKIGPYIYLNVDFHIASSHAQNNFGSLQNGSLLRLKLFDGEFITLYDLKTDKGRIDPYSGHTIFSGQYALGKTELKKISHSTLDKIRVLWATGYEDYEVYHIDILIEQLNCLLAKK